jgi:PAS domain S-box-containing protein
MRKIDAPLELLRLLSDSVPGLIAFMDRDLEYRYLNARYAEWFGIEPADYVGKTPRDLMDPATYETMQPYFERALKGERVSHEIRMAYKFGSPRYVRFYLIPHMSFSGETRGICAIVMDMTAELDIRRQLEQATRAKSRFLAAASHDLRQPLHSLTLLTHALRRRVSDRPEAAEMVEHMGSSLSSLRGMFETLLDVSKLDAGLMKPELREISLRQVLRSLGKNFSIQAESRGLRFSLLPLDAYVETDPAILELTLSNLITNALKFTSEGGILVGCRRRGGKVLIEVYDTGSGVPPERLANIFDEFEHDMFSARGANDGMGLGLSLVRRYCELMNYELKVRSIVGKGTRFSISISEIAEPVQGERPPDISVAVRQSLDGTRILVLDDERHVTYALSRDLEDQGAEVLQAEKPEEAETILTTGDWPDVAIVDYDLRRDEMGDAFVTRMEAVSGKPLPTLILTGSTDPDSLKALAASGRRWLTKPIDPEMLSAAVAGLIQS